MNLPRIVFYYSKSVQNVVINYIFSSESVLVVNSLQIVNSLRVLFLECRGPLVGTPQTGRLLNGAFGPSRIFSHHSLCVCVPH